MTVARRTGRGTARPGTPGQWTAGQGLWQGVGTFGVAVTSLFLAGVIALQLYTYSEYDAETLIRQSPPERFVAGVPFLACFGLPGAVFGTALVVLPLAALARWLGSRLTGREAWWWIPVVAAVLVALPMAYVAAVWGLAVAAGWWSACTGVLSASALTVRVRKLRSETGRRRPGVRHVLGAGVATLLVLALACHGGMKAGLIDEYHPPVLGGGRVAGTWTSGYGATLTLAGDGRATARNLPDDPFGLEEGTCEGTGTWVYVPDPDPWEQTVEIDIAGCDYFDDWRIGGTASDPKLNYLVGDLDSPEAYTLRRSGS
ncbi:hypothetical protein [Streptomyces sp. NPDC000410]|uniref:hypothetical protein n=1 Tax=Streptomyces sp. NPDC000410 TaxID=3154254 RepID=UPI0033174A0A